MNKYKPHVLVLPEDDANRQIAAGFSLVHYIDDRKLQILPPAGGWQAARAKLHALLPEMSRFPGRMMVLLVDFDRQDQRMEQILTMDSGAMVPDQLRARIFVLGVFSEPEDLKRDLGSYENIGKMLAKDCAENTAMAWGHSLLTHNADEAARLMSAARSMLFQ